MLINHFNNTQLHKTAISFPKKTIKWNIKKKNQQTDYVFIIIIYNRVKPPKIIIYTILS